MKAWLDGSEPMQLKIISFCVSHYPDIGSMFYLLMKVSRSGVQNYVFAPYKMYRALLQARLGMHVKYLV